jgi:hypothetical protein
MATFWERRYIRKQLGLASDNQTYVELLPRSGICSGLLIKLAYTNGATGGGGQDIIDAVSKIEVIGNGSDVLFSLAGIDVAKYGKVWEPHRLPQNRDFRAAAVQYCMFSIPFGRFLGDDEHWIDLSAYNTVEAKVTYAPTISATQFATLTGVLDIIGIFYARGVTPPARKGWVRTTQVRSFTSVAAGEDITILSQRYAYLDMLVYAFLTGTVEGGIIDTVELRANGSQYIPFTGRWVDIQEQNSIDLPDSGVEEAVLLSADNTSWELRTGRIMSVETTLRIAEVPPLAAVPVARIDTIAGSKITTSQILAAGSAVSGAVDTTLREIHTRARGLGIGHAVLIPFATFKGDDAALPAPGYDDLRLALNQTAANGAVHVCTRELVPA